MGRSRRVLRRRLRSLSFPATDQEHRLRSLLAADVSRDRAGRPDRNDRSGDVEWRAGARRAAQPAFTRFDGNLAGLAIPSPIDRGTSATSLERWANCPHAYLVQDLLRVRAGREPRGAVGDHAARPGHARPRGPRAVPPGDPRNGPATERPAPDRAWSPAERALLLAIAEERCDHVRSQRLDGPPDLLATRQQRILNDLEQFLDSDDTYRAADGRPADSRPSWRSGCVMGWTPSRFPLPDGGSLPLRGKADRVDVAADGDDSRARLQDRQVDGLPEAQRGQPRRARDEAAARDLRPGGAPIPSNDRTRWSRPTTGSCRPRGQFKRIGYCVTPDVVEAGRHDARHHRGRHRARDLPVASRGPRARHPFVMCAFCDPDGLGTSSSAADGSARSRTRPSRPTSTWWMASRQTDGRRHGRQRQRQRQRRRSGMTGRQASTRSGPARSDRQRSRLDAVRARPAPDRARPPRWSTASSLSSRPGRRSCARSPPSRSPRRPGPSCATASAASSRSAPRRRTIQ